MAGNLTTDPSALPQFLAAVKQHESGGDYTAYNAAGGASGAYQFIQSTWTSAANAAGYGQYANGPASSAPPAVQDAVAGHMAQGYFQSYGNWQDAAEAWYMPADVGKNVVPDPGAGNTETVTAYGAQIVSAMGGQVIAEPGATQGAPSTTAATTGVNSDGTLAAQTTMSNVGTTPANTPDSTDIGGMSFTGTEQQTDALSTLSGDLQAYGFTSDQLDGPNGLINWAWGELVNNTDPTQIALDLQSTPAFQQIFPGFKGANEQLTSQGLPAVSVAQYMQYQQSAMQLAQAGGLPPGLLGKDNIGQLIGGNVSISELTSRLNDATSLAINSTPEQRTMFNQYFGVEDQYVTADNPYGTGANQYNANGPLTTGQIAALALDPQAAEPIIHQQITAAQIGGAGVTAGVGAITAAEATKLAQAGVTQAQATSQFAQIGQLAPLETALPGQGAAAAQQVVNPNQLAEAGLLGTAADVRAQTVAEETRTAPFRGGGGPVSNARGVVGAGSANSSGSGQ